MPNQPTAYKIIYRNGTRRHLVWSPSITEYMLEDRPELADAIVTPLYEAASISEPDYWMSIQHGELKVSYTDDSDPAYKWFPVWTKPIVNE